MGFGTQILKSTETFPFLLNHHLSRCSNLSKYMMASCTCCYDDIGKSHDLWEAIHHFYSRGKKELVLSSLRSSRISSKCMASSRLALQLQMSLLNSHSSDRNHYNILEQPMQSTSANGTIFRLSGNPRMIIFIWDTMIGSYTSLVG